MDQPNLPAPHNNFFHFALSNLPAARSLIETQFPREVLNELNLHTLKLETGSFIDANLREKYSDLLFSVELMHDGDARLKAAGQALVYFLFEHKSVPDPMTVLQLLSYILRIWEQRQRDELPLCPILPLVVYHGERNWTVARRMEELIVAPRALWEYQIRFGFPLLDLCRWGDEQIVGEPVLQSTLHLLKYGRGDQLAVKLRQILELLAQSVDRPAVVDWIRAIGIYVMAVNKEIGSEELDRIIESVFPTQIEPGSLADRLLIQGRQEGKLAGKIQTLQELLGESISSDVDLMARSIEELSIVVQQLQARLRKRDA